MAGRLYAPPPGWGRQESWRAWNGPRQIQRPQQTRFSLRAPATAQSKWPNRASTGSLCLSDDQTISHIPFFSHRGAVDATALELTRNIYHVSAAVKWKAADA